MVAHRQRDPLVDAAGQGTLAIEMTEEVDRKGTAVVVVVLKKP
jgi:hypothetical protein